MLSPEQYLKQKARTLEIGKCYITDAIKKVGEGLVIVTRKHTGGRVSMAPFLVDAYCLGVKDMLITRSYLEASKYLPLLMKNLGEGNFSYMVKKSVDSWDEEEDS